MNKNGFKNIDLYREMLGLLFRLLGQMFRRTTRVVCICFSVF